MRKQLDPRIPTLINNGVKKNHRSFIVLVGDKGRDQVRLHLQCTKSLSCLHFRPRIDCEPSLSVIASPRVCAAVGALVLQEGTRFSVGERLYLDLREPSPTDTGFLPP